MAKATTDQGAGMRVKIKFKATVVKIETTSNPKSIARTAIGIRSQNLTIEEADGGGWMVLSNFVMINTPFH